VAFGWGSSAVSVVVTVVGSDGAAPTTYYTSLAVGDTATIPVPEGATVVSLSRHARQRVRLAERDGRRTGQAGIDQH
jgi:hypothetical protein